MKVFGRLLYVTPSTDKRELDVGLLRLPDGSMMRCHYERKRLPWNLELHYRIVRVGAWTGFLDIEEGGFYGDGRWTLRPWKSKQWGKTGPLAIIRYRLFHLRRGWRCEA